MELIRRAGRLDVAARVVFLTAGFRAVVFLPRRVFTREAGLGLTGLLLFRFVFVPLFVRRFVAMR
jgi:hypothetical protein